MRCQSWTAAIATVASFSISGTRAQDTVPDLGALLAGQKNLTTFYGLIQVRDTKTVVDVSMILWGRTIEEAAFCTMEIFILT